MSRPEDTGEPSLRYADLRHPLYEDATKDQVRDWLVETVWLVAESFGAERNCPACQTVMGRIDRRQLDGSVCPRHGFAVPLDLKAPNPWHIAKDRLNGQDTEENTDA